MPTGSGPEYRGEPFEEGGQVGELVGGGGSGRQVVREVVKRPLSGSQQDGQLDESIGGSAMATFAVRRQTLGGLGLVGANTYR